MRNIKLLSLALVVIFIAVLTAGCGQSKLEGTWVGPIDITSKSYRPIIKIEKKDSKTFSVTVSTLNVNSDSKDPTADDVNEKEEYSLIGTVGSNENVLTVAGQAGMQTTIGYNKDKDVISTMLGSQKVSDFTRIKNDDDMKKAKEEVVNEYKNSALFEIRKGWK